MNPPPLTYIHTYTRTYIHARVHTYRHAYIYKIQDPIDIQVNEVGAMSKEVEDYGRFFV